MDNIIDQEVVEHYNPENLRKGIDNLTIISYEKLFGGDIEEISNIFVNIGLVNFQQQDYKQALDNIQKSGYEKSI